MIHNKKKMSLTISLVYYKASSSHGHPAGSGHSSHSTALSPGSRKINIGGRDFDVAHVAQLLEHMGDIDWRKAEKSIGNHF